MVGAGGHWAGDVYIAGNRNATLRIEVSYAVPNGTYRDPVEPRNERSRRGSDS